MIYKQTCYACESESVSREHVPPKCLFPTGANLHNMITVGSCERHNNGQSNSDEHLRLVLAAITEGVPLSVSESAIRSILRLAKQNSRSLSKFGMRVDGNTLHVDDGLETDIPLLVEALTKIARGIYYRHHGEKKKLLEELAAFPLFDGFELSGDVRHKIEFLRRELEQDFRTCPVLGEHQSIFAYQVLEVSRTVCINMLFYGKQMAVVITSADDF